MTEQIKRDSLQALFADMGFSSLTNIQQKASPAILQKHDCLVIAPTGSGKTECAVIPAFHIMGREKRGGIRCLYITPLRALNRDVFRRIEQYAKRNGLTVQVRHGDTTATMRRRIADSPPDILISTPETTVVLLSQEKMLKALSHLQWVIVDEVHEVLSNERGSQLSITMERLQMNSTYTLTRVGLSATVGNPQLAAKFLVGTKRRCRIKHDRTLREYDVDVRLEKGGISGVADVIATYVKEHKTDSPTLLFTNTRSEAEMLASILKSKVAIPVEMHHGSLSKQVREETEQILREEQKGLVVCTSSLELGIDVGTVDTVIHYGSPHQVSKLLQRIGRSRHKSGRSALGLIVTSRHDDYIEAVAILDRVKRRSIEKQYIHNSPLDVLAHHMVGLLYQCGTVSVQDVLLMASAAFPFRSVSISDIHNILLLLEENRVVEFDQESMTYSTGSRAFWYHLENLSTIPDILKFQVFDSVSKKIIGSLDQRFVGNNEVGDLFVLKGSQWKILAVDEKSFRVNVEPHRRGTTIPRWEGESIPVERETAQTVGMLRQSDSGDMKESIPYHKTILVESNRHKGTLVLHACFGTRINLTLASILSAILSSSITGTAQVRSDAYRIMLISAHHITEHQVMDILQSEYDILDTVTASVVGKHNINWRIWNTARKFGVIRKGTVYDQRRARYLYKRYRNTPLVTEALRELFHEKYDIPGTEQIMKQIRDGAIAIIWEDVEEFTDLAMPILDYSALHYSDAAKIDPELLDIVKSRLYKTKHRLICARCGRWERVMETLQITKMPHCPYCRGRQITTTFYSDHELTKIISKKYSGKKLTKEEAHRYKRAWKVASLVETFGVTAIIVLSGYGVGADTGARILRNMVDEEHMFRQIYDAERQYTMTRGFWDQ